MDSIKNFDGSSIIHLCMWVIFLAVIGAFFYENKGIFGEWFQVFGAGLLILAGLYDLASEEKTAGRVKGMAISACSLILLIPALHTAMS